MFGILWYASYFGGGVWKGNGTISVHAFGTLAIELNVTRAFVPLRALGYVSLAAYVFGSVIYSWLLVRWYIYTWRRSRSGSALSPAERFTTVFTLILWILILICFSGATLLSPPGPFIQSSVESLVSVELAYTSLSVSLSCYRRHVLRNECINYEVSIKVYYLLDFMASG